MAKQPKSLNRLLRRIAIDPKVMVGKPVIRGTRIPVELIIKMMAQGISEKEILQEYPHLALDDIKAALAYASKVLSDEEVFPYLHEQVGV